MQSRPTVFAYFEDESSGTTELHRLARNVGYYATPPKVKSVLVTSATKNEGKSLIASNLSIAMAKREANKRILLLDLDLRRPTIHSLFNVEREPGCSSLLSERLDIDDVVRDTELDNLKVITSGKVVRSASQLLDGAENVLNNCREAFDAVVCDAPPTVPVDDIGMVGPHVDGVILVVMAGKTNRMVVRRAMNILEDARSNVLGVAVNNLHRALPYYYDYAYYGYKYKRKKGSRKRKHRKKS